MDNLFRVGSTSNGQGRSLGRSHTKILALAKEMSGLRQQILVCSKLPQVIELRCLRILIPLRILASSSSSTFPHGRQILGWVASGFWFFQSYLYQNLTGMLSFLFLWSVDLCWRDAADAPPGVTTEARFWSGNLLMMIESFSCSSLIMWTNVRQSRCIFLVTLD